MRYTIFDTPILKTILHYQALALLRIFGWRREGTIPAHRKFVVISAPHTSNWDLPLGLLFAFAFRIKVFWMGKDSLFHGPFGGIMKWLGGIPVDRGRSTGMVDRSIAAFREREKMVLIIAPEGTRTRALRWRTGFYHIAQGAGVPIVLGFLDYGRKRGGIGPVIQPSGDLEADMKLMRDFYSQITPKHPERVSQRTAESLT